MLLRHIALFLIILTVSPLWGQITQRPHGPVTSPDSAGPNTQEQSQIPTQLSTPQVQTPLYVNGRVIMDGEVAWESVSVGLICGGTTVQLIRADLDGYFRFSLGSGIQGNMDFSAAGANEPSRLSGLSNPTNGLFGCEVQISVPGYAPVTKTITEPPDIQGIDVGIFMPRPLASDKGSSISVTSLLVPSGARKEFERADKDLRNNNLPSAVQHLEKAVTQYDKYAAAWNQLGRLYSASHEMDKAHRAYEKAIAGDPRYITPYISLANLELRAEQYEKAIGYADKAVALDPHVVDAYFIEAVGDFYLHRLDAAENSAREAEKQPHETIIPQLHLLLANIFLQKRDYSDAATEMRAYLRESPGGPSAEVVKRSLAEIEKSTINADGKLGVPLSSASMPVNKSMQ